MEFAVTLSFFVDDVTPPCPSAMRILGFLREINIFSWEAFPVDYWDVVYKSM
jgi:hypothetical protein